MEKIKDLDKLNLDLLEEIILELHFQMETPATLEISKFLSYTYKLKSDRGTYTVTGTKKECLLELCKLTIEQFLICIYEEKLKMKEESK